MPHSLSQHEAEFTQLHTLTQRLSHAQDLRELLEQSLPHIVQLLGLQTGWVFLRSEESGFKLAARHDMPPAMGYPGPVWAGECSCQDICGTAAQPKHAYIVQCSRLRHAVGDKRSLAQHCSIPIVHEQDLLGILNIASTAHTRFSEAQIQLLAAIGQMLGASIMRLRLRDQVRVRRVQEQAALLNLSQELLAASSLAQALQRLVRVGARMLEVDSCAFIEADELNGCAMLTAAHGWRYLPPGTPPVVLDAENPHLWYLPERSNNLPVDAHTNLPPLLKSQSFRGHLLAMVEIGGAPIGSLMANTLSARSFLDDEQQLLAILASQLAHTIERDRLSQEVQANQRLEQELALAHSIQASFLPDCCPSLVGYSIDAYYQAARQVGGDFYDFIPIAQKAHENAYTLSGMASNGAGHMGIVIADVTDKGVPAALFMVLSRTLIRATASDGRAPAQVLEHANRLITADARSGLFVTAFYGVLDTHQHTLSFANGGHNYPIVLRAASRKVEYLQAAGLVLGVMPSPFFAQEQISLAVGDVLCFYTDGVTEAMNAQRKLFGEDSLVAALRRSRHLKPDQIIKRILDDVNRFTAGMPQADDITLVVLKREH